MKVLIFFISFGICLGDCAKILAFFPFPSTSHHRLYRPLVRELAQRGHKVTFLTPFKLDDPPPNYEEILIDYSMDDIKKGFFKGVNATDGKETSDKIAAYQNMNPVTSLWMMLVAGELFQESILQNPEVVKLIHSEGREYDVLLMASGMIQESFAALQHKFNAIAIDFISIGGSHWANHLYGNPNNPAYVVDFKSPYTDKMNFWERVHSAFVYATTLLIANYIYMPRIQSIADRYFNYTGWENRPPLMDLLSNKSLVLFSSHYSINPAFPLSQHVVEVGGIHVLPIKPLPEGIKQFMDGAKEGVVVFSLGSVMEGNIALSKEKVKIFLEVFGKLKQRVIWKWEGEMKDIPKNIMILKWIPQQEILAHPNCKLFVTHVGYGSLIEALHHAVPVVGIPLFGDQMRNMKQVLDKGFGIELEYTNITLESLSSSINEVLKNPKYKEAAKASSAIFHDRMKSPLDTAVYWIEYVLRHKGAPHLRSALSELYWFQIVHLDVMALLLVTLYFAYNIPKWCYRALRGKRLFQ